RCGSSNGAAASGPEPGPIILESALDFSCLPSILVSDMVSWTSCLDIALPNIRANLPESQANILLSGQNGLSISGSPKAMLPFYAILLACLLAPVAAPAVVTNDTAYIAKVIA